MSIGFYEGTNAPRAQYFANRASAFKNTDPLQIRAEGPVRRTQRETAIVSEGGRFPTIFTFSHDKISFPAIILLIKHRFNTRLGILPQPVSFFNNNCSTKEDSKYE